MKKLITTAFVLLSATLMLSAQETGKFHGKQHKHKKHAVHQLNLTAEQKEQAKTYRKEFKEKMGALEKNDLVTLREYRQKRDALKKEQKEKMKGLLSADQKKQLADARQKKMEQGEARRQHKMERMSSKLNLSSEQLSKLKSQHEATKQQLMALKQNETYTREQKKEMMKELIQKNKESFAASLTEAQKKQLDEMKEMKKNKKHKRMMAK